MGRGNVIDYASGVSVCRRPAYVWVCAGVVGLMAAGVVGLSVRGLLWPVSEVDFVAAWIFATVGTTVLTLEFAAVVLRWIPAACVMTALMITFAIAGGGNAVVTQDMGTRCVSAAVMVGFGVIAVGQWRWWYALRRHEEK